MSDEHSVESLRFNDTSKSFGGVMALRGVTINLRAGEVLALRSRLEAKKRSLLVSLVSEAP